MINTYVGSELTDITKIIKYTNAKRL